MIEFEGAGYRYAGGANIFADVSVELPSGSFHFLTGPSGAGKTTLLKLCYLGLRPTSGRMTLFGKPTSGLDRDAVADTRQRIGVVHQDCAFLDHLTVAQNISLPLAIAGNDPAAHQAELDDLLKWVELDHRQTAKPPELSGGERQRAALARAVILSPDLIIADEPTGNIDWEMGNRVMTLLAELNKMGKTVLIATHDLQLIRTTAKKTGARLLRLTSGRLVQAGVEL